MKVLCFLLIFFLAFSAKSQAEAFQFVTEPYPPFNFKKDGKAAGAVPEIVFAVCERLKAQCDITVMPWRRALSMAEEGEVYGVFCISKIPERTEKFRLTRPIVKSAYSVYTINSSKLIYKTPEDLTGFTIGAYGPSGTIRAIEALTKDVKGIKIVTEVDNATALRKLSAGRYGKNGAVILNRDSFAYLENQEGVENLKSAGVFKKFNYYIGLSRKKVSAAEAAQFNAALLALSREGIIEKILSKYGLENP
jgi:polar amino acid transport system substrate-binding protein